MNLIVVVVVVVFSSAAGWKERDVDVLITYRICRGRKKEERKKMHEIINEIWCNRLKNGGELIFLRLHLFIWF